MNNDTKPMAEVRVSYSEKKQVKQYEPIDVSCSLTETCAPDKIEETYDRLFLMCREFVKSKIVMEIPDFGRIEEKKGNLFEANDHIPVELEDDEDESGIKITT